MKPRPTMSLLLVVSMFLSMLVLSVSPALAGSNADTVDNIHASGFVNVGQADSISSPMIVNGAVTPDKLTAYAGIRIVHKGPEGVGIFDNIQEAMDSIPDPPTDDRYAILVMPGKYEITEPDVISIKSNVDLIGQSRTGTVIEGIDLGGGCWPIGMNPNAGLYNLTVEIANGGVIHKDNGGTNKRIVGCDFKVTGTYGDFALSDGDWIEDIKLNHTNPSNQDIVFGTGGLSHATLKNVTLKGTCGQVFSGSGDFTIMDSVVEGDFDEFLEGGTVEMRNVKVRNNRQGGMILNCGFLTVTSSALDCPGGVAINLGWGSASVDNSVVIGGLSTLDGSLATIFVGSSKVSGPINQGLNSPIKLIYCHNLDYDPIP